MISERRQTAVSAGKRKNKKEKLRRKYIMDVFLLTPFVFQRSTLFPSLVWMMVEAADGRQTGVLMVGVVSQIAFQLQTCSCQIVITAH